MLKVGIVLVTAAAEAATRTEARVVSLTSDFIFCKSS